MLQDVEVIDCNITENDNITPDDGVGDFLHRNRKFIRYYERVRTKKEDDIVVSEFYNFTSEPMTT